MTPNSCIFFVLSRELGAHIVINKTPTIVAKFRVPLYRIQSYIIVCTAPCACWAHHTRTRTHDNVLSLTHTHEYAGHSTTENSRCSSHTARINRFAYIVHTYTYSRIKRGLARARACSPLVLGRPLVERTVVVGTSFSWKATLRVNGNILETRPAEARRRAHAAIRLKCLWVVCVCVCTCTCVFASNCMGVCVYLCIGEHSNWGRAINTHLSKHTNTSVRWRGIPAPDTRVHTYTFIPSSGNFFCLKVFVCIWRAIVCVYLPHWIACACVSWVTSDFSLGIFAASSGRALLLADRIRWQLRDPPRIESVCVRVFVFLIACVVMIAVQCARVCVC